MSPVRRRTSALVCLALTVAATGCGTDDITEVCDLSYDEVSSEFLDGVWALATVGGRPIPSTGFAVPLRSDRLRAGSLEFRTRDIPRGNCDRPKKSEGVVIATYLLADDAGRPKFPSKVQAGSFEIDHETGTVTLRALGRSVVAPRNGSTLTVTADVPLFGTYVLTFTR
jgi:hypothetical protein